jgi:hypothetical protein
MRSRATWVLIDWYYTMHITLLFLCLLTPWMVFAGVDFVIVAFDEDANSMLDHLQLCVGNQDRVFIYLKKGGHRTHELEKIDRVPSSFDAWNRTMPYIKTVQEIPNSWCCDEASGFLLHITQNYHILNNYITFLHGHVASWHSNDVCSIVPKSTHGFQNINKPHGRRCISQRGIQGAWTSIAQRNSIYANWMNWTLDNHVPLRIVWDCCTQCIVTKENILNRSLESWKTLVLYSTRKVRIPWEYIWPTLLDEAWSKQASNC